MPENAPRTPLSLRKTLHLDTTETRKAKRAHEKREHERWRGALGLPERQPPEAERRAALREARASHTRLRATLWEGGDRLLALVAALVVLALFFLVGY